MQKKYSQIIFLKPKQISIFYTKIGKRTGKNQEHIFFETMYYSSEQHAEAIKICQKPLSNHQGSAIDPLGDLQCLQDHQLLFFIAILWKLLCPNHLWICHCKLQQGLSITSFLEFLAGFVFFCPNLDFELGNCGISVTKRL